MDLQGKSWPPLDSMTCEPLKMAQEPATIGTAEYRAIREIELYYRKHPRQARELVRQKNGLPLC